MPTFVRAENVGQLRLAAAPTVLLLVAGTIPVLTFVVERWLTRVYLKPALSAQAMTPDTVTLQRGMEPACCADSRASGACVARTFGYVV